MATAQRAEPVADAPRDSPVREPARGLRDRSGSICPGYKPEAGTDHAARQGRPHRLDQPWKTEVPGDATAGTDMATGQEFYHGARGPSIRPVDEMSPGLKGNHERSGCTTSCPSSTASTLRRA